MFCSADSKNHKANARGFSLKAVKENLNFLIWEESYYWVKVFDWIKDLIIWIFEYLNRKLIHPI